MNQYALKRIIWCVERLFVLVNCCESDVRSEVSGLQCVQCPPHVQQLAIHGF